MSSFIYPDSQTRKMFGIQGKKKAWRDNQERLKFEHDKKAERHKAYLKQKDKVHWLRRFIQWLARIFKPNTKTQRP